MRKGFTILLGVLMLFSLTSGLFARGQQDSAADKPVDTANLEKSLAVDVSTLVSTSGVQLLPELTQKEVPTRPSNPSALPEEDPLHWYDMEFAGWNGKKTNIPASPADGAIGKKVIAIVHGDHPWTTAYANGMQKVARAYEMDLKVWSPNWDLAVQNQMLDQAINERPDMIVLIPLDAKTAVQQARKVNQAGVPLIMSNTLPEAAALEYAIAWTGPDDFGQHRMLSRFWADKLGKQGGVTFVQHAPGGSPYFARCWGPISELAAYAPGIDPLDMQAPGFEADKTMQLTADWLTRFGSDLKGIYLADDSAQALGVVEALKAAGREDVVVAAAGHSKTGLDLVKEGKLYAITYQSAESDGGTAIKVVADWFNGLDVPPVSYIPKKLITKENVEEFYPPEW